ncbi:MAG: molybdate ABC transporter substrate-binding protein [Rhizobiales bacterium]|nr:molybdate ABC transporter substrate-binding protein [Hyphomicrobiales bacterium]
MPITFKTALLSFALACLPTAIRACEPTSIFAAASTTDAVTTIAADFETRTGCKITTVFAGSSTLAKQIEAGAPAQIFLSANESWMDKLAADHLIDTASRQKLLGNELVLIAPKNETLSFSFGEGQSLKAAIGKGKLALADPASVPAGIYAREALTHLKLWDALADQIVAAGDVRAALAWVERGEARAGIVYRTDARISDKVVIVAALPDDSHEAVTYPVALVTDRQMTTNDTAQRFMAYLASDDASKVFADFGFKPMSVPVN